MYCSDDRSLLVACPSQLYPPLNDGRNALKEDLPGPGKVCGPQIDIGSDMDRFPTHWSSFNIYRKYVQI